MDKTILERAIEQHRVRFNPINYHHAKLVRVEPDVKARLVRMRKHLGFRSDRELVNTMLHVFEETLEMQPTSSEE